MRAISFVALACALSWSSPLSAQIVQFTFSGHIDFIMERFAGSPSVFVNQPSSSTYGFPFALGQQVEGSFTFDLSVPPSSSGTRSAYTDVGNLTFTVTGAGYTFNDAGTGDVALHNDSTVSDGPDLLVFSSSLIDGNSLLRSGSINLRDSTGTAFATHTTLPPWLDLNAHTYHKLFFSIEQQGFSPPFVSMTVQMDTLAVVAVPEPSTAALLASSGVIYFILSARRRRENVTS